MEATRALHALYQKSDHIGLMRHFTERFKGRLVEMALCEVDIAVRVSAIECLRLIAIHGLLEDDQVDQLARLIFHFDAKVRRAVAVYFFSLVDETCANREEELGGTASQGKKKGKGKAAAVDSSGFDDDQRKACLRLKCLAEALVKHGHALDEEQDDEETSADPERATAKSISSRKSRITDAVAALWTVEADHTLDDWQLMADYLVLDHSASADSQTPDHVEDALRLGDEEESVLLEVFVASLQYTRARAEAEAKKVRLPHPMR